MSGSVRGLVMLFAMVKKISTCIPCRWRAVATNCSKRCHHALQVQFKHEDTGTWLSSSSRKFSRPISGQQEVAAKASSGKDTQWRTTEGVYFPEATA